MLLFVSPDIDDDADESETSLACDGQEESVLAGQRTAGFGVLGQGVLRGASDLFNRSDASDLTMAAQLLAGSGRAFACGSWMAGAGTEATAGISWSSIASRSTACRSTCRSA